MIDVLCLRVHVLYFEFYFKPDFNKWKNSLFNNFESLKHITGNNMCFDTNHLFLKDFSGRFSVSALFFVEWVIFMPYLDLCASWLKCLIEPESMFDIATRQ